MTVTVSLAEDHSKTAKAVADQISFSGLYLVDKTLGEYTSFFHRHLAKETMTMSADYQSLILPLPSAQSKFQSGENAPTTTVIEKNISLSAAIKKAAEGFDLSVHYHPSAILIGTENEFKDADLRFAAWQEVVAEAEEGSVLNLMSKITIPSLECDQTPAGDALALLYSKSVELSFYAKNRGQRGISHFYLNSTRQSLSENVKVSLGLIGLRFDKAFFYITRAIDIDFAPVGNAIAIGTKEEIHEVTTELSQLQPDQLPGATRIPEIWFAKPVREAFQFIEEQSALHDQRPDIEKGERGVVIGFTPEAEKSKAVVGIRSNNLSAVDLMIYFAHLADLRVSGGPKHFTVDVKK